MSTIPPGPRGIPALRPLISLQAPGGNRTLRCGVGSRRSATELQVRLFHSTMFSLGKVAQLAGRVTAIDRVSPVDSSGCARRGC
jgi:hypothetical protein